MDKSSTPKNRVSSACSVRLTFLKLLLQLLEFEFLLLGHGFLLGPTLFHGQVVPSPKGQISFVGVDLSCPFPRLDLRRPRRRDLVFNIAAGGLSVGPSSFNVLGRVAQLSAQVGQLLLDLQGQGLCFSAAFLGRYVVQRPLLRFYLIDIFGRSRG